MMPRKPFAVTVIFLGEGLGLLMEGEGKWLWAPLGMGSWGAGRGQLFDPRFINWELFFPLAPLTPQGWRGIPPTYGFPAEERMRLALFGLKTTQI